MKKIQSKTLYKTLSKGLESLRDKKGAFRAANSDDYHACWIRDQLYATYAYYYTGEEMKFTEGMWVVFDILHKHKDKIEKVICYAAEDTHEYIHAKFSADTLDEITHEWGHHQLDAIGLFLFMCGKAHEEGIALFRNGDDVNLIQLLVSYLTRVRYWDVPDNGMWEEAMELHTSSIGACVAGLSLVQERGLGVVPDLLIKEGKEALYNILPSESPGKFTDMAQLSLMWPYNVVPQEVGDMILDRIEDVLVKTRGVNRYQHDVYYASDNGEEAEWTMGFFWLSIVYCERGDKEQALYWFKRGLDVVTDEGLLPELYTNGKPNKNTPLAWSHSFALIALAKLSGKERKKTEQKDMPVRQKSVSRASEFLKPVLSRISLF